VPTVGKTLGPDKTWVARRQKPSQHLVADLQKIAGIEEGVLLEQGIGHGLRMGIERARPFQFCGLGLALTAFRHAGSALVCNSNYASHEMSSKIVRARMPVQVGLLCRIQCNPSRSYPCLCSTPCGGFILTIEAQLPLHIPAASFPALPPI